MAELKNLLAESSRRISLKNREIEDLKALLQSHTTTIETLTQKLARYEDSRDKLNSNKFDNDELREEIAFLKRKYNGQIDRMNKELLENQALIEQLRNQGPRNVKVQTSDSGLVRELRLQIEDLERELADKDKLIMDLNNKIHLHATEFVKEAPKVVRVQDPPIKEVHYEKDPYILEQNAKLNRELEDALKQEQNAKLELQAKIREIRDLNNLISELKARPPEKVIMEKIVTKEVTKNSRIGEPLDILMTRYKARCDEEKKRLALNMLYYYRLFNHYRKLSLERKEKVIVTQKLEVIDGTFNIWIWLRESIVGWLLEIFVRSTDRAHKRKM